MVKGYKILAGLMVFSGVFSLLLGSFLALTYLDLNTLTLPIMGAVSLITAFGVWKLKKWAWVVAVALYSFSLISALYGLIVTQLFTIHVMIMPIIILIFLAKWRKLFFSKVT